MLKNKVYEYVKKYLDKYLFGFDKNQIEMSVLKGKRHHHVTSKDP